MKRFLEEVAEDFAGRNDLRNLCFVFPNRRSSLYFQRYLGQKSGKAIISPKTVTINNLFAGLSGLNAIDKIEALYILYQHYIQLMPLPEGIEPESFDSFVYWGDILLGDFDDIDKYLVNAGLLFANIEDLRQLDSGYEFLSENQREAIRQFWGNFLSKEGNGIAVPRSDAIDKKGSFLSIWKTLFPLYTGFREDLKRRGLAYEGMIYRQVAEDPDLRDKLETIGSGFVFVGLNALNECEKVLLRTCKKAGIGDFYWDYESEMIRDPMNKSSLFMEDNVKEFPQKRELDRTGISNGRFHVTSIPSAIGQTRVAGDILKNLLSEIKDSPESTAIVLPDERLLEPMLNAIPAGIDKINVTMGLPLSSCSIASLMTLLERLHKNRRNNSGSQCFYCRDVIDLIDHPIIAEAAGDYGIVEYRDNLRKENIIYPKAEELCGLCGLFSLIFKEINSAEEFAEYQIGLLQEIQATLSPMEREFAVHYTKAIKKIASLAIPMEPATYFRLLGKLAALIKVQFDGEPLKGLQIMGPLETRALDFDNIIILSVSEGTFPSSSVSSSFIQYNLRRGFNLPTYEFQDSISAYHFYRSIQRAGNVYMVYDSRSDGLKSGEESRYIKQLEYCYDVDIENTVVTYDMKDEEKVDIIIRKDDDVMQLLEDKFTRGKGRFSATSLNHYLDCPLHFFFGDVLGIKEDDDIVESLDPSAFGTIFHDIMEKIYTPFIGKEVTSDRIRQIREDKEMLESYLAGAFSKVRIHFIAGRNIINRELILRCVDKALEIDEGCAPFIILGLEEKLQMQLSLPSGRGVKLYGVADRIDSNYVGNARIVDYKTGDIGGKTDIDLEKMFQRGSGRAKIAFQLVFYELLSRNNFKHKSYTQSIYALRDLFSKGEASETKVPDEVLEPFQGMLESLIDEILNPDVPFDAKPSEDACKYCDFKDVCNKNEKGK